MIGDEAATQALKALSDPTRLSIFQSLLRCSGPFTIDSQGDVHEVLGMTVGEVCCKITGVDKPNSTISHHLRELRLAGLIRAERRGRHVIHSVNPAAWRDLLEYLTSLPDPQECCAPALPA